MKPITIKVSPLLELHIREVNNGYIVEWLEDEYVAFDYDDLEDLIKTILFRHVAGREMDILAAASNQ